MKWLAYTIALRGQKTYCLDSLRENGFGGDCLIFSERPAPAGTLLAEVKEPAVLMSAPLRDRLAAEIFTRFEAASGYDWLLFMEADCLVRRPIGELLARAESANKVLVEPKLTNGQQRPGIAILVLPVNDLGRAIVTKYASEISNRRAADAALATALESEVAGHWDHAPGVSNYLDEPQLEEQSTIVHYAGKPGKVRLAEILAQKDARRAALGQRLNALFEGLTAQQQAAVFSLRTDLQKAFEEKRFELLPYLIQTANVPTELEPIRGQALTLITSSN